MKCIKCRGEGYTLEDEGDGRMLKDACYRCSGTGEVDEETDLRSRLEYVSTRLASRHVSKMAKRRNDDDDGEDWAFCAAEDGMSPGDYTAMHVYDYAAQFGGELSKLPTELRLVLVEMIEELEGQLIDATVAQKQQQQPRQPQGYPDD